MRLLFIKLKHIGDSLLLTPTLSAARAHYPSAEIWVVIRRGCEGIMAGCSAIDRLLVAAAPEQSRRSGFSWWRDWQTARVLRQQRFDYAFELTDGDRGRWLCCLSGARIRCANNAGRGLNWWWRRQFNSLSPFDWSDCHRVEKDFFTVNDCLPLGERPPPMIFERAHVAAWSVSPPPGSYAVLHPGTRWQRKHWPEDRWLQVGQRLLERVGHLVISVGPSPAEIELAASLTANLGQQAINTAGKLSWSQLAGVLYGARLFVGTDTAAMHLAAACACPTVAIFGPSQVSAWRPYQVPHRIVRPPGAETITDISLQTQLETRRVAVPDVLAACDELLSSSRDR